MALKYTYNPWTGNFDIISTGGAGADELVKVDSSDSTAEYLSSKIVNGMEIASTVINSGGVHTLEISQNSHITNTVYVDGNRVDIYTPNGTREKPYKLIQDAIDSVTTATYLNRCIVKVAPGVYTEQITMKSWVFVIGEISDSVEIVYDLGDAITVNNLGTYPYTALKNVIVEAFSANPNHTGIRVLAGGSINCEDCQIITDAGKAAIVNNGSFLVAINSSFQSAGNDGIVCLNGGFIALNGGIQAGKDLTTWDVSIEAGGWMAVTGALSLYNNKFNAAGTVEYRTAASLIGNDSTVVGITVKDALNTLAGATALNNILVITKTFTPATPSPMALVTLPVGAIVDKIKVIIDTPFDGTGATFKVGKAGVTDKYMETGQNDLYAPSKSVFFNDNGNTAISGSPENVIGTLSAGTSSVGSARVMVYYTIPTSV